MAVGATQTHPRKGAVVRLSTIDGRTRLGRRVAELRQLYSDACGGWQAQSPMMQERINTAAHRKALGEHAREKYLAGDDVCLDDLVRAERLGDAAERALGIDVTAPDKPEAPDLQTYLASRPVEAADA